MTTEAVPAARPTGTLLDRAFDLDQIDQWFEEYDAQIFAAEGEVPAELSDLLVEAYPLFKERMEACAARRKSWEAVATIRKAESDRLAASVKALQNKMRSLTSYMTLAMRIANQTKVEGKMYDMTRQATRPKVVVPELTGPDDACKYPAEIVRITPPVDAVYEIDKNEVAALVKRHKAEGTPLPPLPGIEIVPGETVVIR